MLRAVFTLLLIGLFAPAVFSEDKFTVKIKKEAKGDFLQASETDSEKGKSSFSIMGQAQAKDEESMHSAAFKEEILEKEPGKRASKLKRTYQKAEGIRDGKKLDLTFVGKEISITRDGKKTQFTIDGKPLTGDDAVFLNMQFKGDSEKESQMEALILPKQAVAVNEAWKLDMDAIAKDFSSEAPFTVNVAKSSGSGKLTKAYKKDGKQYGVVEVEMTLALTKVGMGAMAVDLNADSKAKVTMRTDGCIDGTSGNVVMEMTMEMKMAGALKTPDGMEVKIDATMNKKSNRAQEDLTGKK